MAEPIGKIHSALAGLKNKTADALKTDGVINTAQKDIMGALNTSPLSLKLNDLGVGELSQVAELDDAWKGAYEYLSNQGKEIERKYTFLSKEFGDAKWIMPSSPDGDIDQPLASIKRPEAPTSSATSSDATLMALEAQKSTLEGQETTLKGEIGTLRIDLSTDEGKLSSLQVELESENTKPPLYDALHRIVPSKAPQIQADITRLIIEIGRKRGEIQKKELELTDLQGKINKVEDKITARITMIEGDKKTDVKDMKDSLRKLKEYKEAYDELQPILRDMDTSTAGTNYQKVHAVAERLKLWKTTLADTKALSMKTSDEIVWESFFLKNVPTGALPAGGIVNMLSFAKADGTELTEVTPATIPPSYRYTINHNSDTIDIIIPKDTSLSADDISPNSIKIYKGGTTTPLGTKDYYPVKFDLKVGCKRDDTVGTRASGAVYENSQTIAFTIDYPVPSEAKKEKELTSMAVSRYDDIEYAIRTYIHNSTFKSTLQAAMTDSINNNATITPDNKKKYSTSLKRNRDSMIADAAITTTPPTPLRPDSITTAIVQYLCDPSHDDNITKTLREKEGRVKDALKNKDAATLSGALKLIFDKISISSAGSAGDKYASFRPTMMTHSNPHFAQAICEHMTSSPIADIPKDRASKNRLPVPTDMTREIILNEEYKIAFHPKFGAYPKHKLNGKWHYPNIENIKNDEHTGWSEQIPEALKWKKGTDIQPSTTDYNMRKSFGPGSKDGSGFDDAVGDLKIAKKSFGDIETQKGFGKEMVHGKNIVASTKAAIAAVFSVPDAVAAGAGKVGKLLRFMKPDMKNHPRGTVLASPFLVTGWALNNKYTNGALQWLMRFGSLAALPIAGGVVAGGIIGSGVVGVGAAVGTAVTGALAPNMMRQLGRKVGDKVGKKTINTRGDLADKFPDFKKDYIDKVNKDESGNPLAESSLNALYTITNVKLLHERCKDPGTVYTTIGSDKKLYYISNDSGKLSCGVIDNPDDLPNEIRNQVGLRSLDKKKFGLHRAGVAIKSRFRGKAENTIPLADRIRLLPTSTTPIAEKKYGELPAKDSKEHKLGPYEEWMMADHHAIAQLTGL